VGSGLYLHSLGFTWQRFENRQGVCVSTCFLLTARAPQRRATSVWLTIGISDNDNLQETRYLQEYFRMEVIFNEV